MTRRDYFLEALNGALVTIPGATVIRNFVVSQQQEYPTPFVSADVAVERFTQLDEEYLAANNGVREGQCEFYIYAGFAIDSRDTADAGGLATECHRVAELVDDAIAELSINAATINRRTIEPRAVILNEIAPGFLDTEMRGSLLFQGTIHYVEYFN